MNNIQIPPMPPHPPMVGRQQPMRPAPDKRAAKKAQKQQHKKIAVYKAISLHNDGTVKSPGRRAGVILDADLAESPTRKGRMTVTRIGVGTVLMPGVGTLIGAMAKKKRKSRAYLTLTFTDFTTLTRTVEASDFGKAHRFATACQAKAREVNG